MNRRRSMTAVLGVAAVVSAVLPMSLAGAAGGAIVNGDFETDPLGSEVVTGWTFANEVVDLGVTSLGGCVSKDTSSYTTLRDYPETTDPVLGAVPVGSDQAVFLPGTTTPVWLDEVGALTSASGSALQVFYGPREFGDADGTWIERTFYVFLEGEAVPIDDIDDMRFAAGFHENVQSLYLVSDPSVRADDGFWGEAEFGSDIADPTADAEESEFGRRGEPEPELWQPSQALRLSSDAESDTYGYVMHGPAAISDPFTTPGARTVTLDWSASGGSDDYHVLGYVVDVDTCQQIEVLDSTGLDSPWQSTSVALPAAGTYRFVFVAGTYDQSWGGAAGARLYVDNIRALPVITGTGLDVQPMFGTGDPVASAPIQLTGGGLQPNSAWTAELHSTPVVLATGTADADGNFWLLSSLPATVEPGKHRIILSGVAPDGSAITSMVWITVTASGTLGYVSTVAEEGAVPVASPPADGSGTPATGAQPVVTGTQPVAGPAATAAVTTTRAGLAKTGFESVTWLGLGTGLVAAGAVVLVASRRRAGQR